MGLLLYANRRNKNTWKTPSGFLLGIFFLASVFAIPTIYLQDFRTPQSDAYWIPMFEFLALLLCFLIPYTKLDETEIKQIRLPSIRFLNLFSIFIIGISLYSIAYFSKSILYIFSLNSLGDARNALYEGESYVENGLANTIASVGASMYVFALLFFFIYNILGIGKKKQILLIIGSLSEPLHILSYVGRDGVVFWIFSFIFLFLFFSPYLSEIKYKEIKKYIIVGSILLTIPFLAISVSRFDSSNVGTFGSMFTYLGEGFVNGPLFMGIEDKPYRSGACFPLYYQITNTTQTIKSGIGGGMLQYGEWRSWTFSTFVTSLYINVGLLGVLLIAIFSYVVQKGTLRFEYQDISFSQMFIYILFFQVFSQGVFYFRQYTRGGNLFILMCFLLFFLFAILEKSGNNIYIYKIDENATE